MKIASSLLSVCIVSLALGVGQPLAAQDGGKVIAVSKLPKTVVGPDKKVTLFVDWNNVREIQTKESTVPSHSTMMYTMNRSGGPITIRRTNYYDGNSAIEYLNKAMKWQRIHPAYIQWGACATGMWVKEFQLFPGKCYVEPVLLQKIGKMETIRYRMVADGKNYYSNSHKLQVLVTPQFANAADQDDWTVTYGSIDLLRKLINDKIEFPRSPNPFVKKGVSASKILAIQTLAKPWHAPADSLSILDAVIKAGDENYARIALATKKLILQRQSKQADKGDASIFDGLTKPISLPMMAPILFLTTAPNITKRGRG